MLLISEIVRANLIKGNRFGIELEVEGSSGRLLGYDFPKFVTERDGSLRDGGAEYVLAKPLTLTPAIAAYTNIYDKLVNDKYVKNKGKAGIHLHLNVTDLTPLQVLTLYCILVSVEDIMVEMYDETRRNNLFCLPVSVADGLVDSILDCIQVFGIGGNELWRKLSNYRYANINIASVVKNGTIELRGLESMASPAKVAIFLTMLDKAKKLCLKYDTPLDFIQSLSEQGAEQVCAELFGDEYLPYYDESKCFKALRCVQEIAYRVAEIPVAQEVPEEVRAFRLPRMLVEDFELRFGDVDEEADEDEDDDEW